MSQTNGITAIIEQITDQELILRIQGRLIAYPRSLINENKQPGDTITLQAKEHDTDEEAHYQAMKRLLKELVQ